MGAVLPASEGAAPEFLYHFSENPGIEAFEPRPGRSIEGRPDGEQLVWAIDEFHAPMYLFPRDCPRIILWALRDSTAEDIERWLVPERTMVAHVEERWLPELRSCALYRYRFDPTSFESIHDHGTHVSTERVVPLEVERIGDLEGALATANVELRALEQLQPLADAWSSSLHFSGLRLRNAERRVAPV